ncbi:unnamed protein product [Rotaria sp. Silwood2]|nr:unnamed protein product [Rotaria sp. Silwood2]CAF2614052.1 unnamed protein product [Rotaria sp. Silwood2]CAF4052027.1 unnamed protein product [Rotaria sp. Silwood2]CAF4175390.1 unnamed protein product [Rotaria sp. Silwood2]
MHEPFVIPSSCHHVSTSRCAVKLVFWYDRGYYNVTFSGESSHDNTLGDHRHFVMIETAVNKFFSYDIHHICKETDDCARIFAIQTIIQMTKRLYNITKIYSDLHRLLHEKSSLSTNLACFDINEAVRQCTVPGMSGSCQIVDDLIKHKFHRRLCLHSNQQSASVNIFDSGSFAVMTVRCNRMLCNGPLTIAAVKKVLQYHNITDVHGRLPGSSSRVPFPHYLFILTTFLSFRLNRK